MTRLLINSRTQELISKNNRALISSGLGKLVAQTATVTKLLTVPGDLLPSEYQEVEYIESNGSGDLGNQYIDTGYKPTPNTSADYAFMYTSSISTYGRHILSSNRYYFPEMRTLSNSQLTAWRDASNNLPNNNFGPQSNVKYIIEAWKTNNEVFVNGTSYGQVRNTGSSTDTYNLFLFAYNNSGAAGMQAIGRLYYCNIYESGTLVRDFVPCYRKADGEIGLYDLVNDVFYTNQGSGSFTKGADVVYGKKLVKDEVRAVSFATDSWETIQAEAERISNYYEINGTIPSDTPYGIYDPENGDTNNVRTITLSTNEQIQIAIIGMCHDTLSTPYGGGGTKAGITWQMVDCLTTYKKINETSTSAGGWSSSAIKAAMTAYFGQLPQSLQDITKQVSKYTAVGGGTSTIVETTEKLFLLSLVEYMGINYRDSSTQCAYNGEGTQYEYFSTAPLIKDVSNITWSGLNGATKGTCVSNGNSFVNTLGKTCSPPSNYNCNSRNAKAQGYQGTTTAPQWLRSPAVENPYWCLIGDRGDIAYWTPSAAWGISYAGCI